MLTVEHRFMIKDLHRRGLSISGIARVTGHDRKTVRRALEEPVLVTPAPRAPRAHKIDPFIPYLQQRMQEDGVYNARKLYGEIQRQGYEGKETQVRAYVQGFRPPAPNTQAAVRFETSPGQQAQVDWGHFGLLQHQGRLMRLYGFLMTLGWSRAMYLTFTVSTDIAHFLHCHIQAFRYFGGVTREVLHDNLKTAVLDRDLEGKVRWHPRYLDFATYYGFAPHACQPYRAQTKGKVEAGVRYVRGNFWAGLRFRDLEDLAAVPCRHAQALAWLDSVANLRRHGTTGEPPASRLGKEGLQPLEGKPDYDTSLHSYRQSSKDCLISYAGNLYSLPASHARQRVLVKETLTGRLYICDLEGTCLAEHRLVSGRGERIVIPGHYADLPLATRPPARATARQILGPAEVQGSMVVAAPEVERRSLDMYEELAGVGR